LQGKAAKLASHQLHVRLGSKQDEDKNELRAAEDTDKLSNRAYFGKPGHPG